MDRYEVPALADQDVDHNDEKAEHEESAGMVANQLDSPCEKASSVEDAYAARKSGVQYVNGEAVITTGEDVSNFLLDTRDDGDPALTFRSFVLGTVFAGLGAALSQVSSKRSPFGPPDAETYQFAQIYVFKPVQVMVSSTFLLLLIFSTGNAWAVILPRKSWVEKTRFARLAPVIHFFNPGPFGLKEVSCSANNRLCVAVKGPHCLPGSMLFRPLSHPRPRMEVAPS